MMPQEKAKRAAAKAATDLIESGMTIGLGSGSTATFFIESLIDRCKTTGLQIKAVATSERSAQQAQKGGIHLCDVNDLTSLDLTIDGADEVDPLKRMIKGGGGALLREKIIASMSREMIVIVDESKLVDQLGAFPLPLEIIPFAFEVTLYKINHHGYKGAVRRLENGRPYITDNGTYIIDVTFPEKCESPERDHGLLRSITGVIETGFFLDLAGRIVVGHEDGSVSIKT